MAATMTSPTDLNQPVLKSGMEPVVRPKESGYSDMLALVISKRKAELKNCTTKVIVVVFDRRSVSVLKPIQSTSMMQTVLRT